MSERQTKTPRQRAALLAHAKTHPALKVDVSTQATSGTVATSVGGGA